VSKGTAAMLILPAKRESRMFERGRSEVMMVVTADPRGIGTRKRLRNRRGRPMVGTGSGLKGRKRRSG